MRQFHLTLAAAMASLLAAAGGPALGQAIPDPALPPEALDPTMDRDDLLRGMVADGATGGQGGERASDGASDDAADGSGAEVLYSAVRAIETEPAGAGAGAAPQPRPREEIAEPDEPVFVRERRREELEPVGLRAGSFLVFPEIETGVQATDNVFAVGTGDKKSDIVYLARPRLRAQSDWGRHELAFAYEGEYGVYDTFTSENPEATRAGVSGRIDLTQATRLSAEAGYAQDQEGRGSVDASDAAAEPTVRRGYTLRGGAEHRISRVTASLRGGIEAVDFENGVDLAGVIIDNSDRDRTERLVGGRLAYELTGTTTVYGDGEYRWRDYDRALDDGGFARDAERATATAGAILRPRAPLRAEISVGLVHEDAADPRLAELDEVALDTALAWAVTPITTLNAAFQTRLDATTVAGASSSVARTVSAGIDHELRRNLVVSSNVSHEWTDYPGAPLQEETTTVSIAGEWWVTRMAALVAGYEHERQTTNDGSGTITENIVSLGMKMRR